MFKLFKPRLRLKSEPVLLSKEIKGISGDKFYITIENTNSILLTVCTSPCYVHQFTLPPSVFNENIFPSFIQTGEVTEYKPVKKVALPPYVKEYIRTTKSIILDMSEEEGGYKNILLGYTYFIPVMVDGVEMKTSILTLTSIAMYNENYTNKADLSPKWLFLAQNSIAIDQQTVGNVAQEVITYFNQFNQKEDLK